MRYFSVSQATESAIRRYVPNHRPCPYLPEMENVKDSSLPLTEGGLVNGAPVVDTATHNSVPLDCLWDRHPEKGSEKQQIPHIPW